MKQLLIYSFLFTFLISCKQEPEKKKTLPKKHTEKINEAKKVIPISTVETEVLKKLMHENLKNYKNYGEWSVGLKEYPYELSFRDEAGNRSYIYYSIFTSDDLNDDGITDYIVRASSDGMSGSDLMFVIMKDNLNIKEKKEILEYAPFSYNNLDEFKYKAKKLTCSAMKNFRAYNNNDGPYDSIKLEFTYQNGNLYEGSYLSKCKLASLENKTIFNDISNISRRERNLEMHNYTETISETYRTKDTLIHADLSGCDNPLLQLEITIPALISELNEVDFFKDKTVSLLEFLAKNTQFANNINPIIKYYSENKLKTQKEITVDNNLVFTVYADKERYDKKLKQLSMSINIERRYNPKQVENWEITARKK